MATANQGQRSSRDVSKPGQQLTIDFGKDFDRDVEFYRRADDAPVFLSTAVDSYSDRDAPIRRRPDRGVEGSTKRRGEREPGRLPPEASGRRGRAGVFRGLFLGAGGGFRNP